MRQRKEKIILEEFGIYTEDYLDCVSFLPPTSYSKLATQQKQPFCWLSRNFHGFDWDRGYYRYNYLRQIVQSVRLRNPFAIFYAKGAEKVNFLSELLECSLIDLNSLVCSSISVNYFTQNFQNHSQGKNNFNKHCANEKAFFCFTWLTNENEELTKVQAPLSSN